MIWSVLWKKEAERRLTTMWINADSAQRQAITSAANRIDALLRTNPENTGESRGDTWRVHFDVPLGVSFRLLAEDGVVEVAAVWQIKHGPRKPRDGNGAP